MNLRFYFITPYYEEAEARSHAFNQPYINAAEEGIAEAWSQLTDEYSEYDGFLAYNSNGDLADLQIKKLPALIVYDVDRQRAIFKLEKNEITRDQVLQVALSAWSLTPDPENEDKYITQSGKSVGTGQLLNAKPCPDWMPGFMCNQFGTRSWQGLDLGLGRIITWIVILVLLFIIYKMVK
ncbi:hypothetical protein [Lewinella sp. LCG006]|uniref:hypothetical protein n=1 Tax=Lewinella sp. LCG006 TaxID=3231911 RepID=UPI0034609853